MTPKEQTHEYKIGESFNLSSISSDLHWNEENELSDYEFKYWTETEEDTGTKYADKSSITFLEKTADLYAQWDRVWFKFKYDKNIIENNLIMKGTSGTEYKFDPYSPDIDRNLQYCSSTYPSDPTTPYSDITELQDKNNLIEVNDENGVMALVGYNAFYYCVNLTSINIPNIRRIEDEAFSKCSNLLKIDFSKRTLITIPTLNDTNAFYGLPSNYKIIVPNSLYDEWTTNKNWSNSSVKPHIVAV